MKEYYKAHKTHIWWLLIGLLVILVTSFAQFMVQTSACSVSVTDLRSATNEGTISLTVPDPDDPKKTIPNVPFAIEGEVESGLLFVPKDASKDNKKPGIVLTHGYLNSRELQLPFAIELARRGFVVLAVDREGHGNYNNVDDANAMMATKGLYESAKYLYNLDYVDQSKIGISGHSMGGYTTAMTLYWDATQAVTTKYNGVSVTAYGYNFIAAGLMQGWSTYIYSGANVSVGLLKASDDEFFFQSTDSSGNPTISREFLHSTGAANFVGVSYEAGGEINIENGARYVNGQIIEKKDGEAVGQPFRAIYEADEIHPRRKDIPISPNPTRFGGSKRPSPSSACWPCLASSCPSRPSFSRCPSSRASPIRPSRPSTEASPNAFPSRPSSSIPRSRRPAIGGITSFITWSPSSARCSPASP